ncbi:uncharacterized protein LOC107496625 [Arachis duranensis]|uniref:Uncharacterized protein LOC107496625 n=1 Tax=Arachis duranensis TaxID=130453 RepID=A0A6P4DSR3_ARADU|nr:uncharacterized protein LOC107496625 [Arachis duranensis]XP_015973416.1 uncharacterized protein LOC107496625 [Arachis duranensis]XP_015973418.1 uncharacterized protein LOC107496625 [Arachis duranensis]
MNFDFLPKIIPWFRPQLNATDSASISVSTSQVFIEQPKQNAGEGGKLFGIPLPLLSFLPWANNPGVQIIRRPTTINRRLRRRAQTRGKIDEVSEVNPARFRPYVSKVPWHTGPRAFFSQLFPRYGHYCGPNWSSGKDSGSPVWDKRPIDWLDFCCYCHDIGYDTHDQAELLKADLAFLECLEKQNMATKGDPHVALIYRTMCINGLKSFLVPYRRQLVSLQSGQPLIQFGWLSNFRWRSWNFQKT